MLLADVVPQLFLHTWGRQSPIMIGHVYEILRPDLYRRVGRLRACRSVQVDGPDFLVDGTQPPWAHYPLGGILHVF